MVNRSLRYDRIEQEKVIRHQRQENEDGFGSKISNYLGKGSFVGVHDGSQIVGGQERSWRKESVVVFHLVVAIFESCMPWV